jgi:hypothetical protein
MGKLAGLYERLGEHFTSTGRFTRAHQHYKQGVQLFESIGNKQASACLSYRLGQLFSTVTKRTVTHVHVQFRNKRLAAFSIF